MSAPKIWFTPRATVVVVILIVSFLAITLGIKMDEKVSLFEGIAIFVSYIVVVIITGLVGYWIHNSATNRDDSDPRGT